MQNRKYKLYLLVIKYYPTILALIYLINTILLYFEIYISIISWFAYTSFLVLLVFYISSIIFQFCIWHRLPLYYILFCNIINLTTLSTYLSPSCILGLNIIIFGFLILLGAYLKNKYNEKVRSIKDNST